MIAYKLFRMKKDGNITSLFINKMEIIPFNKWLKSESHLTKGFAFRPGWHCTHAPHAPHLSLKNRVWCKVKIENFEEIKRPVSQGGMWYLAKWINVMDII